MLVHMIKVLEISWLDKEDIKRRGRTFIATPWSFLYSASTVGLAVSSVILNIVMRCTTILTIGVWIFVTVEFWWTIHNVFGVQVKSAVWRY